MRKFFLIIVAFSLFLPRIQAQQSQENKILMEEYLRQSEKQKKTGLIMLGAGAGSVILGTVLFGTAWNSGGNFAGGASVFLLTAGSISTLVSIPVIVSSASNGRKSAKLGIGTTQLVAPSSSGFSQKNYPTWSISVPLNSQKQ
jgi:hypothetical protein